MQKRPLTGRMLVSAFVLLSAGGAWAGVLDTPLPVLQSGTATQLVFVVPGVMKNNNLETVFICTSLDSSSAVVAVEVFPATAGLPLNDVSTPNLDGAETIGPGETATITTGATAGFHEDEIIDSLLPASVRNGSARIVSTSKRLACSAFLTDEISDPPISMVGLSVVTKKQRGD